ncbi:ABSCISIC ACID-INSENSITIVE 5-like protein 7 [Primulina eburnea]|uniref:ABSCISIC ACID-INSENSITIVE 5-like protein 7 n=1 Tax=Primulina eburnea TaxID=1245227 RepID=UPI003C6C2F6B
MGSYMNFKNFEDTSQTDDNGWNQTSNPSFARQSSIYSLTFDEFQNSLGLPGKEFGSMNMEELLKSIWTAEETHALTSTMGDGIAPNGSLQRQGSLTLPRTLSQKTVDEVWRDVLKETIGVQDVSASGGLNLGPREPTLGEMTLEDFLAKVGVVREDAQTSGGPTSNGVCAGLPLQNGNNNAGLTTEFQQVPSQNNVVLGNQHFLTSANVGIYASGVSVTCVASQPEPQPQLQSILPKRTTLAFSSPSNVGNNSPVKGSMAGITNVMDDNVYKNGARGMGGLSNGVTVTQSSPRNSPHCNVIVKGCIDSPSLSPSPLPYAFDQVGGRGRKPTASLEKVVERRRRRMIKNRESAARSRARKQAYTLELEAEVATLKEMNWELSRKQQEILEMQKNQTTETTKRPGGVQSSSLRKTCLRRTCTGPW